MGISTINLRCDFALPDYLIDLIISIQIKTTARNLTVAFGVVLDIKR